VIEARGKTLQTTKINWRKKGEKIIYHIQVRSRDYGETRNGMKKIKVALTDFRGVKKNRAKAGSTFKHRQRARTTLTNRIINVGKKVESSWWRSRRRFCAPTRNIQKGPKSMHHQFFKTRKRKWRPSRDGGTASRSENGRGENGEGTCKKNGGGFRTGTGGRTENSRSEGRSQKGTRGEVLGLEKWHTVITRTDEGKSTSALCGSQK